MAYPHKWSPIRYKSSAGQRKHIGQRPMLYRWTTQPTEQVSIGQTPNNAKFRPNGVREKRYNFYTLQYFGVPGGPSAPKFTNLDDDV